MSVIESFKVKILGKTVVFQPQVRKHRVIIGTPSVEVQQDYDFRGLSQFRPKSSQTAISMVISGYNL